MTETTLADGDLLPDAPQSAADFPCVEATAYAAVSPRGNVIMKTIAPTADEAWRSLRRQISEPDTLIDRGWRVGRLLCRLEGLVDE